ncbi:hypothetical protein B0H67DRAFT_639243 [Lasiosphaeris hirsuta]|uniref:Uncharacterized protein n=1 Tax=Lasiosphaeris hirsuta TaxID=260670 RepID=A0AA40BAS8_9PEZI|nr:hypothetical protein B0H67DRAFT_639243 [Lasiosphaeris hirsuta]
MAPTPAVAADCVILLVPDLGGRKAEGLLGELSTQLAELDFHSSPSVSKSDGAASVASPRFLEAGEPSQRPDHEKAPPSPSPGLFRFGPRTSDERRGSRADSLRVRLPNRTSSFLADVASLLSGLPICSNAPSPSSRSSTQRFLGPNELAHFAKYLSSKGFNFRQLDQAEHTFISRLLERPSFSIKGLEAIFSHLSEPDRLVLTRHQPNPHRPPLIDTIRTHLTIDALDPAQLEAADSYCAYFTARCVTEHHTTWLTPSLLCHIPLAAQGRSPLHQLIASLNVFSLAFDAFPAPADINNRESTTGRTPLLTLLSGFAWGNHTDTVMSELLGMLLARGAAPELCNAEGNNA